MALSETRLQQKIIAIINNCRLDEDNGETAKEQFASELAKAIIEEIKQLNINYTSGLVAPNGAVTGTINATIS